MFNSKGTPSSVIKVVLMSSSAVGHSTHQSKEHERALSHYYVSPFIHTFASTFALPTFAFYNSLMSCFRTYAFYMCPRFMDNSPTNQLADNPIRRQPTCRQTNSPTNKLAEIDIMTFRLTPKCNGNYESSALSL